MLSILVPVFNYNVLPLVEALHEQCVTCGIDFEILCQDDASRSVFNIENEKINTLSYCRFTALTENLGHRENRNSLAEQAQHPHLLFIDGDSECVSNNFIATYLSYLEKYDVVYGGRVHPEFCPSDNQKLRWKYGKFTEDQSATQRQKRKYRALLFNNTVIKKSCFDQIKFEPYKKQYGHEDTQLAYQLSLINASVQHIDNPIAHADIDSNSAYLLKTKEALDSALSLYMGQKIAASFIKIIQVLLLLQKFKLVPIASFLYLRNEKWIEKNLNGKNPRLWIFKCFKLGYLCTLAQKKKVFR